MTAIIEQELAARGVVEVIVVVKQPLMAAAAAPLAAAAPMAAAADPGTNVQSLFKYFIPSDLSQNSALAAAAAAPAVRSGRRRQPQAAAAALAAQPTPPSPYYYPNLGVMLGTVDRTNYDALNSDPSVASVTAALQISLIRPTSVASARLTSEITWGIRALRVPTLWQQGFTGAGILVGHLDTGVDGQHPALNDAIAHFAQFDDLGREVTPTPAPFDTGEHGTHTAATIAGRPVAGKHIGVAPDAKLASAIVIEGGNVIARLLGGMDWAVGNRVRILSMSLGLRGFFEDFLPITQILRANNILPVFAVGNEGPGTSRSPGNYVEALSVGAYERLGSIADFSSSLRFARPDDPLVPDLVAPGVGVISARPGGRYQKMDGSSMATPHIAGLAALLMQAKPGKSADEVESAILRSCHLKPNMLADRANRGVPDAVEALGLL
jgi:subtilisin